MLNECLSMNLIVVFLLQEPREARRRDWRSSRSDSGTCGVGDMLSVIDAVLGDI